jgi:hypothetical protein
MTSLAQWLADDFRAQSGPTVARWYHRALALIFLDAWISLAVQVRPLLGARGLLPAQDLILELRNAALSFLDAPSIFWWIPPSDGALLAFALVGAALALLALAGVAPRACVAVQVVLYVSFVTVGRTFFSFQWDNLIIECGALAVFLPRTRPSRWAHVLFRLLLFKLYFESGIAKWDSPLGDWKDGSAMTLYYQTAPLPTFVAWYFHHLPAWWHHLESRATLALELGVPLAAFGPRLLRLATLCALTAFQVFNAATANYGFFVYLALALHLFLLDERDLKPLSAWLRRTLRMRERLRARSHAPVAFGLHVALGAALITAWSSLSLAEGLIHFGGRGPRGEWAEGHALKLVRLTEPFRLVDTYHLFAAITTERIEPVFEERDGGEWRRLGMRWQPSDPMRRPRFVAPHQPRLDFQLWFYGLAWQRRAPEYVVNLIDRLCSDPDAVAGFFTEPPARAPEAVRLSYYKSRFTTADERRATGAWWVHDLAGRSPEVPCAGRGGAGPSR